MDRVLENKTPNGVRRHTEEIQVPTQPTPSSCSCLSDSTDTTWSKGFVQKRKRVKITQSCPTLCDPMDYTVHGILQAIIL